ncbi:MAG: hypothetical protein R2939_07580 [Kofleriaceae bacterium]
MAPACAWPRPRAEGWLVGVELDLTVYRAPPGADGGGDRLNQSALIAVAGQYYPRPGVWARLGAGVGGFTRRAEGATRRGEARAGVGVVGGAGVELLARGRLALQLELLATTQVIVDGVVLGGALALGLVVD